jgi:hypothetical protein
MFDFEFDVGSSPNPDNPFVLNGTLNGDSTAITLESGSAITAGTASEDDWWNNNDTNGDYDIFTVSGTNYIDIILPENTVAFSFNVGASENASGWFSAIDNNGLGLTGVGTNGRQNFTLSAGLTPGYGIYANQTNANECTTISSIRVDPPRWSGELATFH